jgi:hypothetical protein
MSTTIHLPPREQLYNRYCSDKHTHTQVLPLPGWAPDPHWSGGACTSHPGVLGSIPKREEPGKTGHPVLKYQVPHGSQVPFFFMKKEVMVRCSRLWPPPGHTTAACRGGRLPPSLQILPHTHILLARSPAPYSPFLIDPSSERPFSNCIFRDQLGGGGGQGALMLVRARPPHNV